MTTAAAYARFSSDAQRDESIEIQLREIGRLCDREGWDLAQTYTDYAISGTREDRPGFLRCVADAERGLFDVLVVYKMDRFARNVSYAQETKRRLFAAGVRIVSVREGEQTDTPDGFLTGGISDLFAEYYSRNLSVLVRGGIAQSARECKAAGRRMFGYAVDPETDRFVPNPVQAPQVRGMYDRYRSGETMEEIAAWLASEGARTLRGNLWSVTAIGNALRNPAYKGVYAYAGTEVEGGMPAIVPEEEWDEVEEIRLRRKNSKRRRRVNDYLLTEKVYCARCGKPMCGTAGTGRSGRKYTYYGCMHRGGCRVRVPSDAVEQTVLAALTDMLSDPGTVDAIAADMLELAEGRVRHAPEWRSEATESRRRRDRLVAAVADGLPVDSVRDQIVGLEERIRELEALADAEEAEAETMLDPDRARGFIEGYMSLIANRKDYARPLVDTFVDRIYVDPESAVVFFAIGEERDWGFDISELGSIKKSEPAGRLQVRSYDLWSG